MQTSQVSAVNYLWSQCFVFWLVIRTNLTMSISLSKPGQLEDTVECFFFSPTLSSDSETWNELCMKLNTTATALAKGYLWHRDNFKVVMPLLISDTENTPVHLSSTTCFGDNIEDEWFIVHIILELTKQFTDVIVQVMDNDGDFLLIEAADYLPSWVNPDCSENRVFIYRNHIHIIPPNLATVDENVKLSNALMCLVANQQQTQVTSEVQNAILNRIGKYPDKIKENTHNAIVKLPLEIATLLKLQPNFIAPIVNTYCHHDLLDIKACEMENYQNNVTVTVKFTKCLYAMLLHSKPIKHLMHSTEKDNKITLGKKIYCGFKMIMNRSSDIYSSKEYYRFLKSLTDNGYFKGNIDGSQEYSKLLAKAKNFFCSVECPVIKNVANQMTDITASKEYLKTLELLKSSTSIELIEDDEDWLNIHPEELNKMLSSRFGKKKQFENNDIITPQNIKTELIDFLKKTSDYEGIESDKKQQSNQEIEFDPDQFENCIEKMLKLFSTGQAEQEIDTDFSDEDMSESDEANNVLDQELEAKLQGMDVNLKDNKTILQNMISSMKEEQASSGPSSVLMATLGRNKTDFLDSDDD